MDYFDLLDNTLYNKDLYDKLFGSYTTFKTRSEEREVIDVDYVDISDLTEPDNSHFSDTANFHQHSLIAIDYADSNN